MSKSKLKVRVPENAEVEKKVSFGERLYFALGGASGAFGTWATASAGETKVALFGGAFTLVCLYLACKRYRKLD